MLMSFLSGYPVGAKLTAEMYEQGIIDKSGAKRMASFTSATGPMFVIGAVGTQILHDYRAGLCILAAHYLATFINGFIYRGKRQKYGCTDNIIAPVKMDKLLWETAYNTVISLLVSCVYIVMFNMIADILADLGVIGAVSNALSLLGVTTPLGTALVYGLTEMTRGCVLLATCSLPIATTAPLCCMLISFGGLSVCLQSVAYLSKCRVNPLYYLLTKSTQALLGYLLCRLFCLLL
jgi:sporulation integral membrane protein YlbJ